MWDRIYSYARVSTEEQTRGQSLEQQKARLEREFPLHNKLFEDVQSGGDSDRPGYNLLKTQVAVDCQFGLKVLIRVTQLDRFGRDEREIEMAIAYWEKIGATLEALDGGIYSTKEPTDWLRTKQEAVYAQYYLKQLSARVRKGKDHKRRLGRPVGNPPFGYQFNQDKSAFEPHPTNWAIARSIVDQYLSGTGVRKLTHFAIQNGWDVSYTGLNRWLKNPVLRGHLTGRDGGWTKAEKKEDWRKPIKITNYNTHPALMSEAEYKQIERKAEENRRHWGANAQPKRELYTLSGLCVCADCDRHMRYNVQRSKGKEYIYISCQYSNCPNNAVCPDEVAEDAVQVALSAKAEKMAELALKPDTNESPELLQLQQQLRELEDMQKRSLVSLDGAIAELKVKIKAITEGQQIARASGDELREIVLGLVDPDVWDMEEMTPTERRILYQELVSKVLIRGRSVVSVEVKF